MVTRSSILAWRISQTEEPGGLQAIGSQRVGQIKVTQHTHTKVFSVVNEAEQMFFLELPCFLYDTTDIGDLTSISSAFYKSRFYI